MKTIITINGDYFLRLPQDLQVTLHSASIVRILDNLDNATVLLGEDDSDGNISLFVNGDITTEGAAVNHGKGSALMVRVTGLGVNPLTISIKAM